jgi:hypothetical protein
MARRLKFTGVKRHIIGPAGCAASVSSALAVFAQFAFLAGTACLPRNLSAACLLARSAAAMLLMSDKMLPEMTFLPQPIVSYERSQPVLFGKWTAANRHVRLHTSRTAAVSPPLAA